uniref:Uncharacterized protein n=1 Tax=Rhizophora mucronata TaxID=61149 RepID=A0A2P2NRK9_RHIMU
MLKNKAKHSHHETCFYCEQ